jgi:NADH-quinone oxidoreductase subunit E
MLGMPPIRVFEVATFYFMFNTGAGRQVPSPGVHDDAVLAARLGRGGCRPAARRSGIKGWTDTAADGMFTLTEVECLGACVNAPMPAGESTTSTRTWTLRERSMKLARGAESAADRPKPGLAVDRPRHDPGAPAGGPHRR